MNKEQQAVIQGLFITVLVVGILTLLWATYSHYFPNTWPWLKSTIALLNYSFGLYLGVLSASLRVKSTAINAPLYVMLIFYVLNVILRIILVNSSISYLTIIFKFLYSTIIFIIAYRQAKLKQSKKHIYTYSRLS